MLADKAYDADRIRPSLRERAAFANIPPKAHRRSKPYFSTWLYRERNLIERFFSKLKHFRRVATRYDKLAENFLAMVQLASMRLWLRVYESTALPDCRCKQNGSPRLAHFKAANTAQPNAAEKDAHGLPSHDRHRGLGLFNLPASAQRLEQIHPGGTQLLDGGGIGCPRVHQFALRDQHIEKGDGARFIPQLRKTEGFG